MAMAESHWHCCHPVASSPGQWPQMGSARFTWLIHDSAKSLPEPCSCCSRVIPDDSRCSRILMMQSVIWFSLKSFESSGQIWPVTRWPACGSLRRSCKSRVTGQSRSTKRCDETHTCQTNYHQLSKQLSPSDLSGWKDCTSWDKI